MLPGDGDGDIGGLLDHDTAAHVLPGLRMSRRDDHGGERYVTCGVVVLS